MSGSQLTFAVALTFEPPENSKHIVQALAYRWGARVASIRVNPPLSNGMATNMVVAKLWIPDDAWTSKKPRTPRR